jgi:hypothetical protein
MTEFTIDVDGPDFLCAAPSTVACAAFFEESRMKFVDPNDAYRKSGGEA